LPDGRHVLFYAPGSPETQGIYLAALDAPDARRLTPSDSFGVYLSSGTLRVNASGDSSAQAAETSREGGWLLWVRAGTLVAQRLDLTRQALTGDPMVLADAVAVDAFNVSAISVSATGLVAYRTGVARRRQLTWVDRTGHTVGTLGPPDDSNLTNPTLSPDGQRVVV